MPSQTLSSREPQTIRPPITQWFCGNCGQGPMSIRLNAHCVFCFRQKDCYAYHHFPTPPPPPPKR